MSGGNIKVVVRCRPLNSRELARGAKPLIRMEGNQTILDPPEGPTSGRAVAKAPQVFSFDKSYWSAGARTDPDYASQQTLFEDLGVDLLNHSFEGFNTCIFAYGQTGSGKSYSMMGYGADKGITPLTTSELFRRVEDLAAKDSNLSFSVEVSYIEIYNEKVRDLLNPKNKGNLKVREHPSLGPYVEDLSKLVVENYDQMMTLMDEGNKARTIASTNMNETSSRSHAVFTLILTQKRLDPATNMVGEKVSKISLVDLAGSERQASTGATGVRLREGANINKSLTTLGKVIAALAQASEPSKNKRGSKKEEFVPYRDSVLTWLLKESLGGNSKTAMIAAISPADYDETLSTLRYADAAKRIKTHAVVNEDPNAKLIRELKEELELLRSRVSSGGGGSDEATYDPSIPPEKQIVTYKTKEGEIRKVTKLELQDQLQASEKLMEDLNLTWEQKMAATQAIHVEREKALEELGISIDKNVSGGSGGTTYVQLVGVHAPQKHPSLVNLNEDPLMSECLVYQLKPGVSVVGNLESAKAQIKLSGPHIAAEHCIFTNNEGEVSLELPGDAPTFVNGKRVQPNTTIVLKHGYRVIMGDLHVFRFNDPAGVRAHRTRMSGMWSISGDSVPSRSDSPAGQTELMDYTAARREVADIEALDNRDLDKLFDDIVKVRTLRGRPESRLDLNSEVDSKILASLADESTDNNPWDLTYTNGNGTSSPRGNFDNSDSRTEPDSPSRPGSRPDNNSSGAESTLEQQALTKQLRTLAQEVKRMRTQAAMARAQGLAFPDVADWTPHELVLARKAVERWKHLRNFAMAEQLLSTAADVREANIIAKQMNRQMMYNFTIVDGPLESPISTLDEIGGIIDVDDMSTETSSSDGPKVMVKVIDHESTCELQPGQALTQPAIYLWTLQRFQQQLARMRQVLAVKDKPGYQMHLSVHTPFGDSPTPSFSYIGAALVPLQLLGHQMSYAVTVPIFCAYTMEAIGSCRVDFKASSVPRSGVASPDLGGPVLPTPSFGPKFSFTVTVDSVKGLTSADFSEVHAQTKLSSLVGPIQSEDTYSSMPVNLDKESVSHLSLCKPLSVIVTSDMLQHFEHGYARIEFYARVRDAYLSRLERFDRAREEASPASTPGDSTPSSIERPSMRRAETEVATTEQHDLFAAVEVQEMGSDGEYAPAAVQDEVLQLHLGVQRQVNLELSHASGQSLKWTRISHATAGNIRMVTNGGEPVQVTASEVALHLQSEVEFRHDGTAKLSARGSWDTAAHHCLQMDRRTPTNGYMLARLSFMVELEGVDEPAALHMDIKLRILARDTRRSSLISFWRSRPQTNIVSIFALDLTPPMARTARDLWRLDTAQRHMPGEHVLGGWRPRSIALISEYAQLARQRQLLADVQTTKVVLDWAGAVVPSKSDAEGQNQLLTRCMGMWQRHLETRVEFDVARETSQEKELASKLRQLVPDLAPRLVPSVRPVVPNDRVIKRGTMSLLKDSRSNRWEDTYAVLRPPYLHLHPEEGKRETQIINVAQASVAASPDVEMLLGRRYAFTLYTPTNSYIIQAQGPYELTAWMTVIGRQRGAVAGAPTGASATNGSEATRGSVAAGSPARGSATAGSPARGSANGSSLNGFAALNGSPSPRALAKTAPLANGA